ncbi:hypothetical protein SAPIO_CDS5933 [Scedosporium apiospermum]|uniref:AAA+ ATPase domain-containing protein n=1 Tax=Pseudallescheria apiosperma TaxID=563466 RepID=A0A084G5R5_PSEDA|nr:uncharacterized protein SAPIO_CDS5933 [Scedosporium apiospermum]KEZ42677.1 hypothetical protein SAPIO_CDS5933 [Scedosporium apiospermum]
MDDAAWGALKEEFPGDWTWMILSLVPSWMLPECAAKHSVGYCRSCAMKPATSMAAGVQYSCPTSGCGHVYTPDQTRLLARFALRLLADKPSLFEVSKRTSSNQGEQSLGNSGLPESEATRHESIFLPRMWPQPYDDKHRAPGAILLYGPPGTGKSDLVKALAKKVNHTFLTMSQVPLYQVLEPEEFIRELFAKAREKKPAIIFCDKIDSNWEDFYYGYDGKEKGLRMIAEVLSQLGDMDNTNAGVVVVATATLPWELDPAVRTRFDRRVYITLPDHQARMELIKVHAGKWGNMLSEADLSKVAEMTNGYSKTEMSHLTQLALIASTKKMRTAEYFRMVTVSGIAMYAPCKAEDGGAMPMTLRTLPIGAMPQHPPLTADDFLEVMRVGHVKLSTGMNDLSRYETWTKEFGVWENASAPGDPQIPQPPGVIDPNESLRDHTSTEASQAPRTTLESFPARQGELESSYKFELTDITVDIVVKRVEEIDKGIALLSSLYTHHNTDMTIIFVGSEFRANDLVEFLDRRGVSARSLVREHLLDEDNVCRLVNLGRLPVLVTDHPEVPGVSLSVRRHIITYDFPADFSGYLDQLGLAHKGKSTTFVNKSSKGVVSGPIDKLRAIGVEAPDFMEAIARESNY